MLIKESIQYNIVGDTKTPLLRYIPFLSKIKIGADLFGIAVPEIREDVSGRKKNEKDVGTKTV